MRPLTSQAVFFLSQAGIKGESNMTFSAMNDGVKIAWRVDGPEQGRKLVLLNSIGTDMRLWDHVMESLSGLRILRIDTRGHGKSDAPDGDYSLTRLAEDVLAVMDDAGFQQATIGGVSLGGMMAMELALLAPKRVSALVLICTSAQMDSANWAMRVEKVRQEGMQAIADLAISRFFSPDFIAAGSVYVEATRAALLSMSSHGYAGCGAAIRDMRLIDRLKDIQCPALIITGNEDESTPYEGHGDRLEQGLKKAKLVRLPGGHLMPLEQPVELSRILIGK